ASGGIIYNNPANPNGLQFRTGGNNTRMSITSAGNVGVGTSTPGWPLHVLSGVADAVRVQGPASFGIGARLRVQDDVYDVSIDNFADGQLAINTAFGLGLMGGSVGIGTTSPVSRLSVVGNTNVAGEVDVDSAGASNGSISGNLLRFGGVGSGGSGE